MTVPSISGNSIAESVVTRINWLPVNGYGARRKHVAIVANLADRSRLRSKSRLPLVPSSSKIR